MKAPAPTWAEREKMDSEYMHLMAELGQGQAPDVSKMSQSKCIISRNGAQSNAPQPLLSIQHNPPNNNNNNNNYDRYSDSPRSSNNDDWSNSPKPNDNQSGVVEEVVNGRKIIDMTGVKQVPYQHGKPNAATVTYSMQQHHQQQSVNEEDQAQNMANQAMMYSQQMNFFAQMGMPPFMPMWPGQPVGGYGWPMAGGQTSAAPPPPPPPPPVSDPTF
jgi:hypothetical protein